MKKNRYPTPVDDKLDEEDEELTDSIEPDNQGNYPEEADINVDIDTINNDCF